MLKSNKSLRNIITNRSLAEIYKVNGVEWYKTCQDSLMWVPLLMEE